MPPIRTAGKADIRSHRITPCPNCPATLVGSTPATPISRDRRCPLGLRHGTRDVPCITSSFDE
jgi:hypothetical protein